VNPLALFRTPTGREEQRHGDDERVDQEAMPPPERDGPLRAMHGGHAEHDEQVCGVRNGERAERKCRDQQRRSPERFTVISERAFEQPHGADAERRVSEPPAGERQAQNHRPGALT
jgi:hypothetical protein